MEPGWPSAPPREGGAGNGAMLAGELMAAGALRSELAGVMRGLSAIFWGLPMALLAFARHFLMLWPTVYDLLFPVAAAALLTYGVTRLGGLHRQERIWQRALLLAQIMAVFVLGLAPFLFFWSRMPHVEFFSRAVAILLALSFAFVVTLTRALLRLSAMLPDETARADARLFHGLSTYVVCVLLGVAVTLYVRLSPIPLDEFLTLPRQPFGFGRQAILLLLTLVPVAMAMAVAWKLKEVVMAMLLGGRPPSPGG